MINFIGNTTDQPLPIHDKKTDAILQQMQDGIKKPHPKVLFKPDQIIRITESPFNNFNDIIKEINYKKNRLRIAILIFSHSTPIKLKFDQIKKS